MKKDAVHTTTKLKFKQCFNQPTFLKLTNNKNKNKDIFLK